MNSASEQLAEHSTAKWLALSVWNIESTSTSVFSDSNCQSINSSFNENTSDTDAKKVLQETKLLT